jgi:hypothetical protein
MLHWLYFEMTPPVVNRRFWICYIGENFLLFTWTGPSEAEMRWTLLFVVVENTPERVLKVTLLIETQLR